MGLRYPAYIVKDPALTKYPIVGADNTIRNTEDALLYFGLQDPLGAVSNAWNIAVALADRSVALLTIADYTLNANWSNPSGQIARHAAGSVETLQQDGILAAGTTWQVTITVANRTAGSITITEGGAAIDGNGEVTRIITSTGTDFIITPTSNFDGDIDVAILLVQQTNILASTAYRGAELLDESGDGVMDKDNWLVVNSATLTNPSVGILKVARSTVNNPAARELALIAGKRYSVPGETRSDGNATPVVNDGITTWFTGTISTDWQTVNIEFVSTDNEVRLRSVTGTGSEYTEWRNLSATEANPLNGDDVGTTPGVAMGRNLGKLFDGSTALIDISSAELNSMLNFATGSAGVPVEMDSASVWVDGVLRYVLYLYGDANNYITIAKSPTNDSLVFALKSGGTEYTNTYDVTALDGVFVPWITWDGSAVTFSVNNTLLETFGAIGTWAANLTVAILGAKNGPANVHHGKLQYPSFFTDAINASDRASINRSLGVS